MELKKVIIILIAVIITAAVLGYAGTYLLGVSQSGFSTVKPVAYSLNQAGEFSVNIGNFGGSDTIVWAVAVRIDDTAKLVRTASIISAGQQTGFLTSESLGHFQKGDRYKAELRIVYGANEMNLTTFGTVSGYVE